LENSNKFISSHISVDIFRRILQRYNRERKAEIIFLTGGEPLMHPDFDKLVDICKGYRATVKASTNGILVKSKISSLLKLDYVNVSVDAYSVESFEKHRGGTSSQFDLIIDGLKTLKKSGARFSMSYLLTTENLADIDKMFAIAEEIKPSSVYFHNINPHGCRQYKPLIINDENTRLGIKRLLKRADYPFDIYIPAIFDIKSEFFLQAKCVQPWHYFCFNSVGNIAYCCHFAHDAEVGNISTDYDFNSPKMMMFRSDIIKGKILKSCLYCQRRFMNKEFARFDSKIKKWFVNNA
jgi:MoaA/NifB/PqqE/SkfB family radical SAM enzyme